jgi:CDP-diacylglycerol--serine O-phosphatidyltransferase
MIKKEGRSGIYLLPNILTTLSLFAAFYSIVASMKAQFEASVVAIFIGMIADCLDGRMARLTNTQSDFGAEYDSLSDMVTFGVAPALLLYSYSLQQFGKIGWLIAFIYTAACALRLARFNTQVHVADKRYFQGLACTPAAGVPASYIWLCHLYGWQGVFFDLLALFFALSIAMLMVSNIRYASFKEIDFKGKVPFIYLSVMIVLLVAVAANPAVILFLVFLTYTLSGPTQTLWTLHRVRKQRKHAT